MPLNEIPVPEFFHPEIRHLIDFALEDAWQELRKDGVADTASLIEKLAATTVALAIKLKNLALHAARAAYRPRKRPAA
jgi:hypothetical protein